MPTSAAPPSSGQSEPSADDPFALTDTERELLSQWREQGASLTDVNDQLMLRQSLPADMQDPDIMGAIAADPEAMEVFRSDPEALANFVETYQTELQRRQYEPQYSGAVPQSGYSGQGPTLDQALSFVTQPVMPESHQQHLQMDPNFYRVLALAGGDFDPNGPARRY